MQINHLRIPKYAPKKRKSNSKVRVMSVQAQLEPKITQSKNTLHVLLVKFQKILAWFICLAAAVMTLCEEMLLFMQWFAGELISTPPGSCSAWKLRRLQSAESHLASSLTTNKKWKNNSYLSRHIRAWFSHHDVRQNAKRKHKEFLIRSAVDLR